MAYNYWIREFTPFGTNQKFQVFLPSVKKMRALHTGTDVPVPGGRAWEEALEVALAELEVKSIFTVDLLRNARAVCATSGMTQAPISRGGRTFDLLKGSPEADV